MFVQHVGRPDVRRMIRRAVAFSVPVLLSWGAVALLAWGMASAAAAAPVPPGGVGGALGIVAAAHPTAAGARPAAPAAGHYTDHGLGFSLDHPAEWRPHQLAPCDPPGAVLGLPATPVPGSVGGVEFPYSSHIDLSLIVQDTAVPGGTAWGTEPLEILAGMAASEGVTEALLHGTGFEGATSGGLALWGLTYTPKNGTERMWVVAPAGRYHYLFFLTVGGAADDRGTVQQMFDQVVPSFTPAAF